MKQTQTAKNIDRLLLSIQNPSRFILLEEFKEINNINSNIQPKDQKLYVELKEIFLSYDYIESISSGAFKFTAKGYEARSAGGHFNYVKSAKPKMTKFELWSLIIAMLAICVSALTYYNDYSSKSENEELIKRIETLEKQVKK